MKTTEGTRLSPEQIAAFQEIIHAYYRTCGRDLPWRRTQNPYHIFIAEIMLQQTQVERVCEKYDPFLVRFPDFPSLAAASVGDVLASWQGLGYNRRALALLHGAKIIVAEHGGRLPACRQDLLRLPGVGEATAASLCAFAFNEPAVFIETNIRRVFIHHFFPPERAIRDAEILPLVAETLDRSQPAAWYHALMDYGSHLKKIVANPNRQSAHYARQSPFAGSERQLRGMILRTLLTAQPLSPGELARTLNIPEERLHALLADLHREGFLTRQGTLYRLA